MRAREDVPLNAFLIGFGNNSMSLLAGIMVLCTVFAINPGARSEIVGAGNEGLTFIWMPQLFAQMPAGRLLHGAVLSRPVVRRPDQPDLDDRAGVADPDRRGACRAAARWPGWPAAGLVFGAPSALSLGFLHNQDWVWGVGLMLSGLFFALAARRFGLERLRREVVNADGCDLPVGRWWTFLVAVVVPIEAVILMVWWLWEARGWDPGGWLDPLRPESVGTVLLQFAVALAALIGVNRWLGRRRAGGRRDERRGGGADGAGRRLCLGWLRAAGGAGRAPRGGQGRLGTRGAGRELSGWRGRSGIYLTGFMGAGKTAVGRRLAETLGWEFIDLDRQIERAADLSVAEIFERRGEPHFRRLEREALAATLRRRRVVVATGGGALAQPGALESLRGRGLIVWLKLPFAELAARVEAAGAGTRPLLADRRRARQLYRERLPFYRRADLVFAVDGGQTIEQIARRLAAELGVEACAT